MSFYLKRMLVLGGLMLAGTAQAQFGGGQFPASDESPDGMLSIESEDDVPQAVQIQEVAYVTRDNQEVKLKVISPAGAGGGFGMPASGASLPLVVYVQGSAWFYQDNSLTLPRMSAFVEQSGFVVASVQYRPSTTAQAPAQLQDVKSAIRFMRVNAQRFGIDPERIAIWGDSSGGHMSAMVGTTEGLEQFVTEDNASVSTEVSAVIDFFGPTDFRQMSAYPSVLDHDVANSPESTVIGGPIQDDEFTDLVALYNPITYISADKNFPPFLIMHGDQDELVPFNQSVILYEALKEANQDVTFYKIKGAGHGSRFYTPAVLDVVIEFLNAHL